MIDNSSTFPSIPKVTIVTPSYNQAPFLEETILSVLNQDYPNIEYIVIDGGSTDGSVDIIRKYENRLAYWVSEADRGQSHAINKGWLRSTGDILAWLNSDDYYEPGAIKNAMELLQANQDAVAACAAIRIVDAEGQNIRIACSVPVNVRKMLRFGKNTSWRIQQPTVFMKRKYVEQAGWLDPNIYFLMDMDLFLRLLRMGPFIFSNEIWANFRLWDNSKTCSEGEPRGEYDYIISKHWPKLLFNVLIWQRNLRTRLAIGSKMRSLFRAKA